VHAFEAGVASIENKMRESHLQWYEHVGEQLLHKFGTIRS